MGGYYNLGQVYAAAAPPCVWCTPTVRVRYDEKGKNYRILIIMLRDQEIYKSIHLSAIVRECHLNLEYDIGPDKDRKFLQQSTRAALLAK